jgi:hypothetical protein
MGLWPLLMIGFMSIVLVWYAGPIAWHLARHAPDDSREGHAALWRTILYAIALLAAILPLIFIMSYLSHIVII